MAMAGEVPIFRLLHISMFDRIVMYVIKTRPEITFPSNAGIPITIPNAPPFYLIKRVQFIRCSHIEALHKKAKIGAMLRKKQKMVMVREHNPGSQFNLEFCYQPFEYACP